MRRALVILALTLTGSLLWVAPTMIAGRASAAPTGNSGWTVTLIPHYNDMPRGTTLEWFYVHGSGQCIDTLTPSQVRWVETVGSSSEGPPHVLFRTYPIYVVDDCSWSRSFGTWQVRITTPTNVVRTGSLHVTTGTRGQRDAAASCLDFSNFTCHGDYAVAINDNADLHVIFGPVGTGTAPGSPWGS